MAHNDVMDFPKTFKEFLNEYSFIDNEGIYTNKNELIQTFRVEQGYEHFEKIIRADEKEKTINEVLKNIEIGIEATGHYDQYATGFCNALIWLRSCITSEEPQFLEQLKEQKGGTKVTCIDCVRYGDLHSSCSLARDLKLNEDSPICENFKRKCTS